MLLNGIKKDVKRSKKRFHFSNIREFLTKRSKTGLENRKET